MCKFLLHPHYFRNNSMFGKTMENLRNRRNIDLVTSEEAMKKLVKQPSFKRFTIFHEGLVAVERIKVELLLNRPIYVGFAVLDLRKTLMYDFHYNFIKKEYPKSKSMLLFTDTDSLTYKVETDDIYEDFRRHAHLFDFSGYPKEHKCYSAINKIGYHR